MSGLRDIPLLDIGDGGGIGLYETSADAARRMLDAGRRMYGAVPLVVADRISRAWLARNRTPYGDEVDHIARGLGRPGAHVLNLSFEWGCTTSAHAEPGGGHARLMRVLDWPFHGLGREVVAARRSSPAGEWLDLTWPGAVGVIQATAPGRFAAAINQAPMTTTGLPLAFDWLANRRRVWRSTALPPPHLLRRVFEQARTYAEAKCLLTETEICIPTLFTLAGVAPGEGCVIERTETRAVVTQTVDGAPATIANKWLAMPAGGRARADENDERRSTMVRQANRRWDELEWLVPPILNERTRLAFSAEPATGALVARGFEVDGPATTVLRLG